MAHFILAHSVKYVIRRFDVMERELTSSSSRGKLQPQL